MRAVILLILAVCVMAANARILRVIEVEDDGKSKITYSMPAQMATTTTRLNKVMTPASYNVKLTGCDDLECELQCLSSGYLFGMCFGDCICWG